MLLRIWRWWHLPVIWSAAVALSLVWLGAGLLRLTDPRHDARTG